MEYAPRTVNTRIFCHNCHYSFSELIDPEKPGELKCSRCGSDFIEILEKGATAPPDATVPESPTIHGRYAAFLNSPSVRTQLLPPQAAPTAPHPSAPQPAPRPPQATPPMPTPLSHYQVHIEERPTGYTYIMTGPSGSFHYQTYHTTTSSPQIRPATHPEEKKEVHKEPEESKAIPSQPRRQWHEQLLNQNLPQYMNMFMSDAEDMNWQPMGGHAGLDPFSPNFMSGMVFGHSFPHLRLHDFFSESDPFFPTNLGINLQDFGMNFASNFRRGNLIDLVQLISMADQGSAGKPPASKEVLSKLPIFKVEEKHCKKDEKGNLEYPNCAVCCSNINLGENAQLIPCGHMFHPDCIKPWFMQHNTCPICRYELPTDDPYYEEIRKRDLNSRQQQRSEPSH